MASLRTIIAQGRKRIGLLVGAGAPAGMARADGSRPLIPAVAGLTDQVLAAIAPTYDVQIKGLKSDLDRHDIETLLSRIRSLGGVIGKTKVHDLDGDGYKKMAEAICAEIGQFQHIIITYRSERPGVRDDTRIGRKYPIHIRENVTPPGP